MLDEAELRRGFAASRGYLLSHHLPSERHRCYTMRIRDRQVHLCARCSGIYPGIAVGLLAYALAPPQFASVLLVTLLPLPALVDWTVTAFTDRRGHNVARTATGALLGYAYAVGLANLFVDGEIVVFALGLTYALLAGILLSLHDDL